MNQPSVSYFFLGANSMKGFYSLYDRFCSCPNDTLHIIKSGPGTGKSTFMKRIGHAAQQRGYDVEYILCSGDPNSLDGVYIPALHIGWVDGTAPHVLEPRYFGVSGDYVDLGQFCRRELLTPTQDDIRAVTDGYKRCYKAAYAYLEAAGILTHSGDRELSDTAAEKIRNRARSKIRKELSGCSHNGIVRQRFLRGLSCQGSVILSETLETLCSRLCVAESHFGVEQLFFREIVAEIRKQQASAVVCPNPLCPERIEAVLLPEQGLCFLTADALPNFSGKIRTLHLDSYLTDAPKADYKPREKQIQQLLRLSYDRLAQAKALHDRLEAYYRPALDVEALDRYTNHVLETIR